MPILALLPFLAVSSVIDLGTGKFLGWTADGQSIVWTTNDTSFSYPKKYFLPKGDDRVEIKDPSKLSAEDRAKLETVDPSEMMGAEPQTDETAVIAVVHDVRRGDEQKFVMQYKALTKEGTATGTLKKKYASLPDVAAFEAWKKLHPIAKTAGRKGVSGSVNVAVKVSDASDEKPEAPKWKRNSISWSVVGTTAVELTTKCGKDTATETLTQEMDAMFEPSWTATPYWDPTGHRVLFVLDEAQVKTMRGIAGGASQYVIVPCGPRVEVLAPAGLEKSTGPVADAAEKAGFTVVSIGVAKQPRTATVIYTNPAHTDVASKLVTAIPGGATVDKLTWKPNADVVIAIGDSAK